MVLRQPQPVEDLLIGGSGLLEQPLALQDQQLFPRVVLEPAFDLVGVDPAGDVRVVAEVCRR